MSSDTAPIKSISDAYLAEVVRYDEFKRIFALGIVGTKILVRSFPFMLPSLGVFARARLSEDVNKQGVSYDLMLTVEHEDGGEPVAMAMSRFNIEPGFLDFLFRAAFTPPRFERPGKYFLCMREKDDFEKLIAKVQVTEIHLAS